MSISTAFVEIKEWYTQCINTNAITALRELRIRITHIFVQTDWTTKLFSNTRFEASLLSHSGLIQMSIQPPIVPIDLPNLTYICQNYFTDTGANIWLTECQSKKSEKCGYIYIRCDTSYLSILLLNISEKQREINKCNLSLTRQHDFTSSQNGWAGYEDKAINDVTHHPSCFTRLWLCCCCNCCC